MRSFKFCLIAICVFYGSVNFVKAQENPASISEVAEPAPDPSLSAQFNELKEKSNTFQEYKVIRISNLNNFWKNVQDTLKAEKQEILDAQQEIARQNGELIKINQAYQQKEKELQQSDYEIAHINVLGLDILKSNYIYFNWAVITILITLLAIVFIKYNISNKVAQAKKSEYEAIDRELNDYKQKAREKELKIKRELQTEMNRVEELNQEVASLRRQAPSR
ncbi:hypothetical protein BH23BAC1_BH23BAC1_28810 [soil metagenome]